MPTVLYIHAGQHLKTKPIIKEKNNPIYLSQQAKPQIHYILILTIEKAQRVKKQHDLSKSRQ